MAETIEVGLWVSTPEDGYPGLNLAEEGAYEPEGFGPGGFTWRRRTVQSDYQHGEVTLTEVLEESAFVGIVRVYGTTWAEVRGRATAMFEALSQHVFIITTLVEGVTDLYVCGPANIRLVSGDVYSKPHLFAGMQEYQISAPYNPTEVFTS